VIATLSCIFPDSNDFPFSKLTTPPVGSIGELICVWILTEARNFIQAFKQAFTAEYTANKVKGRSGDRPV